jgi:hypothetical protein
MTPRTTSNPIRNVLGAVGCILVLAYLAACSVGGGFSDVSVSQTQSVAIEAPSR